MTNHVHLVIRSETHELSNIMRDMKKHSSKKLIACIQNHPQESRKKWMLWIFKRAGQLNPNNQDFQLWQQHNQPIELDTHKPEN